MIALFSATICPEPGVPLFGSYIGRLELGKTVTYSCYKAGLTLIGEKVRTCLHEVGKGNYWTGTLPSCKGNFFIHTCFLIGISQVHHEPEYFIFPLGKGSCKTREYNGNRKTLRLKCFLNSFINFEKFFTSKSPKVTLKYKLILVENILSL